jgi:hypothetical protein
MESNLLGENPREEGEEVHAERRVADPRKASVLESGSNRPRRNHRDDSAGPNVLRLFK